MPSCEGRSWPGRPAPPSASNPAAVWPLGGLALPPGPIRPASGATPLCCLGHSMKACKSLQADLALVPQTLPSSEYAALDDVLRHSASARPRLCLGGSRGQSIDHGSPVACLLSSGYPALLHPWAHTTQGHLKCLPWMKTQCDALDLTFTPAAPTQCCLGSLHL